MKGPFDSVIETYSQGRKEFPAEVLDILWGHLRVKFPSILDVGCGTGIGTRQIRNSGAKSTGCDISSGMIDVARLSPGDIEYVVAPAHRLPFRDETFDAITAFSALHWFCDSASLHELNRVMRPGGVFLAVNRRDTGEIHKTLGLLRRELNSSVRPSFDAQEVLSKTMDVTAVHNLYQNIHVKAHEVEDYWKSTSHWGMLTVEQRDRHLRRLSERLSRIVDDDGFIFRRMKTRVVVARKRQQS